jgi:hypothetical protein
VLRIGQIQYYFAPPRTNPYEIQIDGLKSGSLIFII